MAKRIEIRGIIVGPEYDASWAESYIARGIITPESRVRALIAAAAGQDIDLYINSYGGSVFDGNEMLNALKMHRASGSGLEITVGAMAMSMAAVITVCSGAKVKAFRNTKFMFHGATTITWAGKQAHEDTAALLGRINGDCIQALVQKFGVPQDVADSWFAEGRMGWLSAEEAQKYGIVSEIIDADDTAIKVTKDEAKSIGEQGLDIAACGEIMDEPASLPSGSGVPGSVAPPPPNPDAAALTLRIEQLMADVAGARSALDTVTQDRDTAVTERDVLRSDLASAKSQAKEWQSKFDKLTSEHGKAVSDLAAAASSLEKESANSKALNDRLLRVAASTFCRTGDGAENGVDSIEAALKACGNDGVLARQRYPGIFAEYRRTHGKGRKSA